MAFLSNLHTHTHFSDGHNSAEEYVLAAIEKGFVSIGFSEHAYTVFDDGCCIRPENIPAYHREVRRLREVYRDKIEVYLGMESEGFEPGDRSELDYVVGSVHFLYDEKRDRYNVVDYKTETYEQAIDACGGVEGMVCAYYGAVVDMAKRYRPDIIGHLDLIQKNNRGNRFFDPGSPWHREIMNRTADGLAASGCIVEVNTGALSRGQQADPNPPADYLKLLQQRGVPVTISSDAHCVEHLNWAFDEMEALLREVGYRSVYLLRGGRFAEIPL